MQEQRLRVSHMVPLYDKMNLSFAYNQQTKDHGGWKPNQRVLQGQKMVVKDLISTGGSVLEAVVAAKREWSRCSLVVAIFS